jgi:LacI family transcriptional regulator
LKKNNIPYVLIDRQYDEIDSNYVIVDNFDAAYKATQHLIQNGFKRIANITLNTELQVMADRTGGYKQALVDAGIEPNESLIKVLPFSHESGHISKIFDELFNSNNEAIDALFFSTSKLAVMGIEYLNNANILIPDNVAVVSFDSLDAFKICTPQITVISQPLTEIGKSAIQILLNELKAETPLTTKEKIILPTQLKIRSSSVRKNMISTLQISVQ